jgi:hypothetical protein
MKKGPILPGTYSLMAIMRKVTDTRYFRKWNAHKQVWMLHFFNASWMIFFSNFVSISRYIRNLWKGFYLVGKALGGGGGRVTKTSSFVTRVFIFKMKYITFKIVLRTQGIWDKSFLGENLKNFKFKKKKKL